MFQSAYLTRAEKIEEELADIQQFLESEYMSDNPTACKERLTILSQHMARSGKLKADAEHHYSTMYNGAVMSALKQLAEATMSTSTINEYIKSMCRDYKQLVVWSDRTNRACVHQIDVLRTIVSFSKQEFISQSYTK